MGAYALGMSSSPESYSAFVQRTNQNDGPIDADEADCRIHGAVSEMVAEAGEVLEIIQKANRLNQGEFTRQDMDDLYDECSDVLWGLQALLNLLPDHPNSIPLLAEYNMEKLEPTPPPVEPDPPVKPPIIVDPVPPYEPPVKPTPPPSTPNARPGEDLQWYAREVPDQAHATITPDMWSFAGERGSFRDGFGIGDLYRAIIDRGIMHPIIAVHGACGDAFVGGKYGRGGHGDLTTTSATSIDVTFVGRTENASINVAFSFPGSRPQRTGVARFFNLGLRGGSDSFVVRASSASDEIYLDGCWWLGHNGRSEYTSGLHIHAHGGRSLQTR